MIKKIILLLGIILTIIGFILLYKKYLEEKSDKYFENIKIEIESIKENTNENTLNTKDDDKYSEDDYIGIIEIPKINLKKGFLKIDSKYNSIKYNVQVIKGSTFPDTKNNNLILAAHSGNCHICYFDKLYKLNIGDITYIYYKDIKYTYELVFTYEIEKTGKAYIYRDINKNTLTLITCTNNSKTKQTIYILELINKENIK